MAAFCVSCGAPLAEGVKFCSKCGAAVQAAPAAPASAAPTAPPLAGAPSSGGSNTAVKIIIGVLAVFVFLSLVLAGSCFYIGYRVRKRAHEFSQQMGGEVAPYKGKRQPCAMLTSEEAGKALGQPVASVEQIGTSNCEYHFGPGGNQRFAIDYTWDGGAMAFKLSHAAMKSVAGMETFTPVQGIGDEAYIEPMGSGLLMRKGDVMVNMDLRVSGVSVDAAKIMAAKIADRL
jgi:zinc-ribbon domain